eukprot:CAMPEP_0116575780 /NCGR_PEP_ID=MMETSP0397-20121206/20141_1 /TAXON_ID=216820 /ORGANISM="Cyclophora tenuis, Strain ECT3854" /LENGTH=108 /DNA_ID=CAMNT_0004104697 /DNA_START=1 /DNA_END=327 /DNA_ORIENTATION=-
MQRLDAVLIEYCMLNPATDDPAEETKRTANTGEIAIRMLYEDDNLIAEAGMLALSALIEATKESITEEDIQCRENIERALTLSYSTRGVLCHECVNACNAGDFSMEAF